jgi:hypothetical protein
VLWQRDGALDVALRRVAPAWPSPDPQWIEDRFWIWIHYSATKLGRGELFECLDALAFLRSVVFGPLIARARGHHASGVRRLEQLAPDLVDALAATIGDHSPRGCAAALRAAVDLYRELRDDEGLARRGGGGQPGLPLRDRGAAGCPGRSPFPQLSWREGRVAADEVGGPPARRRQFAQPPQIRAVIAAGKRRRRGC